MVTPGTTVTEAPSHTVGADLDDVAGELEARDVIVARGGEVAVVRCSRPRTDEDLVVAGDGNRPDGQGQRCVLAADVGAHGAAH
jgi:hypothetical protein